VEGYTYRGQTFDEAKSGLTPLANRWRIEVQPSAARTDDVFLHVLTTDEPEPSALLRKGDQIGARVGDAEVLFDSKAGGAVTIAGKEFSLQATVETGEYE